MSKKRKHSNPAESPDSAPTAGTPTDGPMAAQGAGTAEAPRVVRRSRRPEDAPNAGPEGATEGATEGAAESAAGAPGSGGDAMPASTFVAPPRPHTDDITRLLSGTHDEPHAILGAHPAEVGSATGVVVRCWHPDASGAHVLLDDGREVECVPQAPGLWAAFLREASFPLRYRTRFHFADGGTWEREDPYRFLPTVGDVDLHLFGEGTHRRLWDVFGAHPRTVDGVEGVSFAVWAPNARRVSVVGDFCRWDGRLLPMRMLGTSGVWELFVPGVPEGALYKYELITREGEPRLKTDPFAFKIEQHPGTSSIVTRDDRYAWEDDRWMAERPRRDVVREPMSIYEVHLGSWARVEHEGNRAPTYAEIAERLAQHVSYLGFTHIELLPVAEHPFAGSWGYQVAGYFAPSSRWGTPDDFRHFVDVMHRHGIGVILDWVPAHFPKDDWALRRFDGTALYEHEDPRLGEHPDWGTLIFNYGRTEVRNFLTANALYWLEEFHVDGLRVDAVASMLYLDYSRQPGEWLRNRFGGRENLEAIDLFREVNSLVGELHPGCFTAAEESTAWPGVTKPVHEGGLGFTFKWNMGWMHDTLQYFAKDPLYRRHHHDQLTFAMMYEYTERFVMPLSHDEVVHLKKSLLDKMPGDEWQKFANLRVLLAYQWTRPGKKLVFMGTELAPSAEWNHDVGLPWHAAQEPLRAGMIRYVSSLGALYKGDPAFWRHDHDPEGFQWIDVADRDNSVVSYLRRDGERHVVVVVLNLTPAPREHYRIGFPTAGEYELVLDTDAPDFGGSGYGARGGVRPEHAPFHGFEHSAELTLPPLSALVYRPVGG